MPPGESSHPGGSEYVWQRVDRVPLFSIRMVFGIFCSDTETGAVTPPGVMQKK